MLDENKMDGGEIMQTLAQEFMKIGEKRGEKIGKNEGIKIGAKKEKIKTAQNLLDMGIEIETKNRCSSRRDPKD